MKINNNETFGTNEHLFIYKSNDRYINKTCDEIIWESYSNQKHIIFHDRTRYNGTSLHFFDIEGIRIIREIENEDTNK